MISDLSRKKVPLMAALMAVAPARAAAEPFEAMPWPQQVSTILLVALGLLLLHVGILALLLLVSVLRPDALRRGSGRLRAHPVTSFFAGILVLVLFILCAKLLEAPLLNLLALPVVLGLILLMVSGIATVAFDCGDRILSNTAARSQGSSFMAVLAGGTLLILIGLVPFAGQTVQAVAALTGIGAAAQGWWSRARSGAATPAANTRPQQTPKNDD